MAFKGNSCVICDRFYILISHLLQDAPYRATIMEPLGKMNAYFPVVNEHIAKRNKKVISRLSLVSVMRLDSNGFVFIFQLLDYDAARSKLRKVIEKPSEDPTKLPKAQQEHDEAQEVFELMNGQLITELPQLLDLRIPYFDPSFEAMIRMQCKFAEEGYEKMSAVQRCDSDFGLWSDYIAHHSI